MRAVRARGGVKPSPVPSASTPGVAAVIKIPSPPPPSLCQKDKDPPSLVCRPSLSFARPQEDAEDRLGRSAAAGLTAWARCSVCF